MSMVQACDAYICDGCAGCFSVYCVFNSSSKLFDHAVCRLSRRPHAIDLQRKSHRNHLVTPASREGHREALRRAQCGALMRMTAFCRSASSSLSPDYLTSAFYSPSLDRLELTMDYQVRRADRAKQSPTGRRHRRRCASGQGTKNRSP